MPRSVKLLREQMHQLHLTNNPFPPDLASKPILAGMRGDPWRILVTSLLKGKGRRPVLAHLLYRYPSPGYLITANRIELEECLSILGQGTQRASLLVSQSEMFLAGDWDHLAQLPGVVPSTIEAVRVFALGDLSFTPEDRVLRSYVLIARDEEN